MNKSDSIAALATALATAQTEVENANKNAANPHFRNRYADLAEVLNTVRPVFAKHGLSIMQFPSYEAGIVSVETVLTHKSGEWMSGTAGCKVSKDDAQGVGSAITYLRRYSLAAVAGVAQEDDDGEGAVGRQPNGNGNRTAPPSPPPTEAPKATVDKLFKTLLGIAQKGGKEAFTDAWKQSDKTIRMVIANDDGRMAQLENACIDWQALQDEATENAQ